MRMTLALCLIQCDYQSIKKALQNIRKVSGVIESHETTGPYDMLLKVQAESQSELDNIIKNLTTVSGVLAILTTIVYNVK